MTHEQIAKGLTKAQRAALRYAYRPDRNHHLDHRLKASGGWRTTNKLYDLGLTDVDEFLTADGIAVRAILEKQDD